MKTVKVEKLPVRQPPPPPVKLEEEEEEGESEGSDMECSSTPGMVSQHVFRHGVSQLVHVAACSSRQIFSSTTRQLNMNHCTSEIAT